MNYKDEMQRLNAKYSSATQYVLSGLIPYTEANLKLTFKPSVFFNDLEKLDQIKAGKKTLKSAYYRAIKQGLVEIDEQKIPRLTKKGLKKVKPYKPERLKGSRLMVIFDIPEERRYKRNRLRTLLRELSFNQVQKSVWTSDYDHRQYLRAEIADMQLQEYVKVYEASQIEI